MKQVILSCVLLFLSSCAQNPNRAGCSFIDGEGRYGTLFQNVKGDVNGAHIYIGENIKNVTIICNANKQEIMVRKENNLSGTDISK